MSARPSTIAIEVHRPTSTEGDAYAAFPKRYTHVGRDLPHGSPASASAAVSH